MLARPIVVGALPWALGTGTSLLTGDEPSLVKVLGVTALGTVLLAVEVTALSLCYRELRNEGASP